MSENKTNYKKFLETLDVEDIPYDTLRRARKKLKTQSTQDRKSGNDGTDEYKDDNIVLKEMPEMSAIYENVQPCTSKSNSENKKVETSISKIEIECENVQPCISMIKSERINTESNSSCNKNNSVVHNDEVSLVNDLSTQFEIVDSNLDSSCSDNESDSGSHDTRDRSLLKPRDLSDLMSNKNFLEMVTTPVNKSPAEIFLMLLKYTLANKLPLSMTSMLFELVNTIFATPVLPESKYILDKILNPSSDIEFHGICPYCGKYVGKLDDHIPFVTCNICSLRIDLSKPSLENIFIIIDPSKAIQSLINDHKDYYYSVVVERRYGGVIKDIYDGKCYRSFVEKLPQSERHSYLTAILNTDGAPRFESSKNSIWPVYLLINELPIEVRLKNTIPCAIWFGKDKPPMNTFLEPLVNKLNELSVKGIETTIRNQSRTLKLYVILSVVDSVARAPMQGVKQFNGTFGCNWCLHTGEWFEGSMRYPIPENRPEPRTMEQMIDCMKIMSEDDSGLTHYFGVKNVTPLINLKYFDVVNGFVPDYMHCCLAGVGKQVAEYFFNSFSNEEIVFIDTFLKKFKVPGQLARLSRPISDRGDWKAREWENFILYYSLPLFRMVLKKHEIEYWTLLVKSLYILLKIHITSAELDSADEMLHQFNVKTEQFFTKKCMSFNIHQLLHLSTSVLNWGPLWSHSTFAFESANHDLLQAIQCAKGVNLQIVRYVNFQLYSNILETFIYPHASPTVRYFCTNINENKNRKSFKLSFITYLGNTLVLDDEILNRLQLPLSTTFYSRAVIKQCLYASSNQKNQRSDNSNCRLLDGRFVRIKYFAVNTDTQEEVTLCNIIKIKKKICDSLYLVDSIEDDIVLVNTKNIDTICVCLKTRETYISVLPNLYHY